MGVLIMLGLFSIISSMFLVYFWTKKDKVLSVTSFLIGVAFLVILSLMSVDVLKDGSPKLVSPGDLEPGKYKVAFVYLAGRNVTVGIEKIKESKEGHLYVYQLPWSAFDRFDESANELHIRSVKKFEGEYISYELVRVAGFPSAELLQFQETVNKINLFINK